MDYRPHVLISACSCNPERGSEPGVGHFFVSHLAKHCDLTVITEEVQNRAAIERRQRVDPVYAGIHFQFIPWPWLDRYGHRIDDRGSFAFYQALRVWEQRACSLAQELFQRTRFDLVHHLTMQGYREPGFMWKLPAPFIWGPTGGHAQMPWRYFGLLGWRGCVQQGGRNVGNWLQARFHGRVHRAARAASGVIVNTMSERDVFRRLHGIEAHVIAEFGTHEVTRLPRQRDVRMPLRVGWSGVHIPRKALPILLHALALLPASLECEAHILGDGPESGRWKQLADRLGVDGRCHWHGRLPRDQALGLMSSCDAFALTSLIDGTSCVLNEAISEGLPVICHRVCGFPDVVDDNGGIVVPLGSPRTSAMAFAAAIQRLACDAPFYNHLAAGVRQRAQEITGETRCRQILRVYESVLRERAAEVRQRPCVQGLPQLALSPD